MFPLYHSDCARARGFRESRVLRKFTGGVVKGSLIVVSGAILIYIYIDIYIYIHRCTTSNSQGLKGNSMETCQEAPLAMNTWGIKTWCLEETWEAAFAKILSGSTMCTTG